MCVEYELRRLLHESAERERVLEREATLARAEVDRMAALVNETASAIPDIEAEISDLRAALAGTECLCDDKVCDRCAALRGGGDV